MLHLDYLAYEATTGNSTRLLKCIRIGYGREFSGSAFREVPLINTIESISTLCSKSLLEVEAKELLCDTFAKVEDDLVQTRIAFQFNILFNLCFKLVFEAWKQYYCAMLDSSL